MAMQSTTKPAAKPAPKLTPAQRRAVLAMTLTEILAALGYTHRKSTSSRTQYAHDIFAGDAVVFTGTCHATVTWLRRTGQWRALALRMQPFTTTGRTEEQMAARVSL